MIQDIPHVRERIESFLSQMDADCSQFKREFDAEVQLHEAVQNYEKVFGVKINVASGKIPSNY